MSIADDPLPDLVRTLRSPLPDIRARAARALGKLGWLARDAMPQLVNALNDADGTVRESAAQAIGQMGPEVLTQLVRMLGHPDKYVRRNAVWSLGRMGPAARPAVADLAAALKDADARTAAGAAQAIGSVGSEAAEAVPQLTEAMRGTNIVLCRMAAKALSQIGRPALAALIAHLKHRDPFVRGEAALALGWIGPDALPAVPALIEAIRPSRPMAWKPDPKPVSESAPTPTTPVTPAPGGPSPEETSRVYAAQALGRIGPEGAGTAIPALQQATEDPNDQVREAARQSLRQVQGVE
jgi:HEAT repeat protein